MSSQRYTIRLPEALAALVHARVQTGTSFAVLMRDALTAYLLDTPPAGAPPLADRLDTLGAQLAILRARVEALEQVLTRCRQPPATRAATPPPSADTAPVRVPVGQFKLTPRQVRALRAKRARGVPIKVLMQEFEISKATLFRYLK